MGSISIWHWLIVLLIFALPVWLISRVVAKSGLSGWWSLLCFVPVINLIMLWVFAYSKWPTYPER